MSRLLHRLIVETELRRAWFTPAERREFFGAWNKPGAAMTAAECGLFLRHGRWLAANRRNSGWPVMVRVYERRIARFLDGA